MDAAMLNELESQHRGVERVLAGLADATEADEQRSLVAQLVEMLIEHMEVEEREVYPELETFDAEMAEEASVEHGLVREGLRNLGEMIGEPGFGAAVDMVKAGIAHHVEDEEEEAFPLLRRELGLGSPASSDATKAELYEQAKEKGIEGRSTMSKQELEQALGKR